MPHVVLYLTPDVREAPVLERRIADASAVPAVGDRVEVPLQGPHGETWGEVDSVTWSADLAVAGVLVVVAPGRLQAGAFDEAPEGWTRR